MRYLKFFLLLVCLFTSFDTKAQMSSQKEAAYFATLKAVANYKIDDEENKKEMEQLRQDANFNDKLNKMLSQLNNKKNKNTTNKKIYNILRNAGKQIYDELS